MGLEKNLKVELIYTRGESSVVQTYTYSSLQQSVLEDSGFYMEAIIEKGGDPSKNTAEVILWGIGLDRIEQFTTLQFLPLTVANYNKIKIYVDDGIVFAGDIIRAFGDFTQQPNIALRLSCITGAFGSLDNKPPLNIKGSASIESLFKQLANNMGFNFINYGVTGTIDNVNLVGSSYTKVQQLAKKTSVNIQIDDNVLSIFSNNFAGKPTLLNLSSGNGLLGYPTFSDRGINFYCEYNPLITLQAIVNVTSIVPKATGKWRVFSIKHTLQAMADGDFYSFVQTFYESK